MASGDEPRRLRVSARRVGESLAANWVAWQARELLVRALGEPESHGQSYRDKRLNLWLGYREFDPAAVSHALAGTLVGGLIQVDTNGASVLGHGELAADDFDRAVEDHWNQGNFFTRCGHFVEAALLGELCRERGYGCVTANGQGSHADMDFDVMATSFPPLRDALTNITPADCADLPALRRYGISAERNLLAATGGINTYRGALFELLLAAAGAWHTPAFAQVSLTIAGFSRGLERDFIDGSVSGVSLRSYREYGELGIRGDALAGLPQVLGSYVPTLEAGINVDDLLPEILSRTWDTTTIQRGGVDRLFELRRRAATVTTPADRDELSAWCVEHHLSTGGTADQLILSHFLRLVHGVFTRGERPAALH